MYKINYYTLSKLKDGNLGNIEQFKDIGYTQCQIVDIPKQLQDYIDNKYGIKYEAIITSIEYVTGEIIDNNYYEKRRY